MPAKKVAPKAIVKKGKEIDSEKVIQTEEVRPVSDKQKSIDRAIKDIQTKFGDEAIMTYGNTSPAKIAVVPTGSIGLDAALGVGGLPRGRIIEIYGPESSGKTTLSLHVIAEAQKKGGICAFID